MRIAQVVLAAAALASLPAPAGAQATPETRRIRLDADTIIDGVHCAPTGRAYAEFFLDGRLAECPLAEDATIGAHALPAGTWVVLHPDGRLRLAWLSRHTRIGGVVCKGTGYKDWVTTFHDDGSLAVCYLPETTTIQGIPCRAGTLLGEITGGVQVRFHPDGRLESCALARAVTIDGVQHRRWTRVHPDDGGGRSRESGT